MYNRCAFPLTTRRVATYVSTNKVDDLSLGVSRGILDEEETARVRVARGDTDVSLRPKCPPFVNTKVEVGVGEKFLETSKVKSKRVLTINSVNPYLPSLLCSIDLFDFRDLVEGKKSLRRSGIFVSESF